MVLDRLARREEDDDLLLEVLAEEGEEEEEPLVAVADDVALLEVVDGRRLAVRVDVDVEGTGAERHAREVGDLGRLGGGEEHRLAVLCGRGRVGTRRHTERTGTNPWGGDR